MPSCLYPVLNGTVFHRRSSRTLIGLRTPTPLHSTGHIRCQNQEQEVYCVIYMIGRAAQGGTQATYEQALERHGDRPGAFRRVSGLVWMGLGESKG